MPNDLIEVTKQSAKEYIKGSNNKAKIVALDNVDVLQKYLLDELNKHVKKLNAQTLVRLVGNNTSHSSTRYSQKSNLETYLKGTNYNSIIDGFLEKVESVDLNKKEFIKSDLLDLLLYVKYQVQEQGNYLDSISKQLSALHKEIGEVGLQRLLTDLAANENLKFFDIVRDYINLEALDIVRARFLHSGFQVGRNEAYVDRKDGDLITLRNPETLEDEEYRIQNIVTRKFNDEPEKSLIGKIYIPTKPSAHPMVHVTWRGSSSVDTWISDAQITPGFTSYLVHEHEIIQQISDAVNAASAIQQNQPVHLMISGHSLGASLSQVNYNSVQRALCRGLGDKELSNTYNESLKREASTADLSEAVLDKSFPIIDAVTLNPERIASMHVTTFNAPGVLDSVAQSSNECSKYLTTLGQPIPQFAHFSMNNGDLVQVAGKTTILTALEQNGAHAELFYFDNGHVGSVAKAALIPAAAFVGAAAGSIVPGVGTVAGTTAGIAFSTSVVGYGLFKGHTEKFVEPDTGAIVKSDLLKRLDYASSRDGEKGIEAIRFHAHNKSVIAEAASASVSTHIDPQGKVHELTQRAFPGLPANRKYAFPINHDGFTGDQAKHMILQKLNEQISAIKSTAELTAYEHSLEEDPGYQALKRPQGVASRLSSLFVTVTTTSKLKLDKLIEEKRELLKAAELPTNQNPDPDDSKLLSM